MKDQPASLGVTCGHMSIPPVVVDFLDPDYCYKSVATQIRQDVGLGPARTVGDRTRDQCVRDSYSACALWRRTNSILSDIINTHLNKNL